MPIKEKIANTFVSAILNPNGGACSPKTEPGISSINLAILKFKLRIVSTKLLITNINI